MKLIKVGAAVLNQTPRDWDGNFINIRDAIQLAKKEGVSVLCLPEACITGYGLEDDLFCADLTKRAMARLFRIATLCENLVVCVGLPIRYNNALYAGVATIVDKQVVGITCKQNLAGDGIHYEPRHFKAWPTGIRASLDVGIPNELKVPIGDIYFNVDGIKIGYEICEDAWVAQRPGTRLAGKGVDIIMNPSGSHFSFGKLETRKDFVVDGSRAFNCTYIYSNLVGLEAGRAIYDGGALIASGGRLLAIGKRFTFKNVDLTTAVVDTDTTRTQQVRTASFHPTIMEEDRNCVFAMFDWTKAYFPETLEQSVSQDGWEYSPALKHEECTRALGLALMDYMRKSRTKGFVISLSGGADSAMVTYLCAKGIEMGVLELGVDEFIRKYCPHIGHQIDIPGGTQTVKWLWEQIADLRRKLITTAYQATAQSGVITKTAAREVATELNVTHFEFDVDPMVKAYATLAEQVKGQVLNFNDDGLVLQNLQARVRAPGIWMIANMQQKLLLTTSNMSEAAVGYATMDGDTAGCVAPIAGLPKCYIREYLRWVESTGVKSMGLINDQQPTAELLPSNFAQTDEKDLMPYPLLHKIEGMVVKNRYSPLEIYRRLRLETDIENDLLVKYITKFFRLFSINQWKRERYALSFHMDDHNLDPRTWCRTPILTGGYEEELKELATYTTTYNLATPGH
jgi:NAD+ synthase (glutamine-hydrolysing)